VSAFDRVPVVTAFLTRRGRVLLLRRSQQVGTYRGRWAGVSGYVERLPLEQAHVELQEETGLGGSQVQLRGVGIPVPIDDEQEDRHWLVYPFVFALKSSADVRPDWESVESRWVTPDELPQLDTVPGLAEVLSRVWPPFGTRGLWSAAERIAADRTSGATDLALAALAAFERSSKTKEAQWSPHATVRAARALAALRPSMAVIPHVMCLATFPGRSVLSVDLQRELHDATAQSAQHAADALSGVETILTHSASSAVEAAIRVWSAGIEHREVIVTESRPRCEGVGLAERLSKAGVSVRLIADAQIGLAASRADAVLVGADGITDDDLLINKAGTRLAALAARDAGTPTFAVCQTHKIAPPGWPVGLERQEPADVHSADAFRVENVAFDATPLRWFSAVLTEKGKLTRKLLQEVRRELERSDLVPVVPL
jgi:translation initiation factor 2B subunit (eIF-2B alpha/beta/delta family)/8-oxo-dGTP pyrophosphatase MutT (NUDIX family)